MSLSVSQKSLEPDTLNFHPTATGAGFVFTPVGAG